MEYKRSLNWIRQKKKGKKKTQKLGFPKVDHPCSSALNELTIQMVGATIPEAGHLGDWYHNSLCQPSMDALPPRALQSCFPQKIEFLMHLKLKIKKLYFLCK